ncbi:hypothetical protein Ae201684_002621 [Aphanomyces euteiches]|nr:hypothetical protein Ae201684_002621 [Aphanomyces euteiches]
MADRLDRLNQSLTRENQRLKTQFSMQENDREFLVRQLVSVKKDNVRLRKELADALKDAERLREEAATQMDEQELGSSLKTSLLPAKSSSGHGQKVPPALVKRSPSIAGISGTSTAMMTPEVDNRYKEIIKRLKRVLEVERRNLRQVRNAYTADLQTHTELSIFLRQCIEDVKSQLERHTASPDSGGSTVTILGTTFHAADRQKVIDLLLSQERVLSLLYAKAFPLPGRHEAAAADVTAQDLREIFNNEPTRETLTSDGEGDAGAASSPGTINE